MTERQFTMGVPAQCADGECGEVIRVVIDPFARRVTHLVVEPKHRQGLGKLVPLELVESSGDQVNLRCSRDEFEALPAAEETDYLPGGDGFLGYGANEVFPLPYYGLGPGVAPQPVTYDRLPLGEVAVRRGDPVQATDGEIGRVQGLVIEPSDGHVTHILLQEGHFWGREEIALPINAVASMNAGITLRLSKQQVQELPPVNVDRFGDS